MTVETPSMSMRLESLSDGTTVFLRPPDMDDLERSLEFFRQLPQSERRYLRFDVTQREVVERLIREAGEGRAYRILALVDDEVVGHGALELSRDTWQSHIGEIRVIVTPTYRQRGLGAHLISELFRTAEEQDVERVVSRLAERQFAVRKVCERLGFVLEAVLRDRVRDAGGGVHDLIVMGCGVDDVSRAMRELYQEDEFPEVD